MNITALDTPHEEPSQNGQQNTNYKLPPANSNRPCRSQSQEDYLQLVQQVQRIQEQLAPIKRPWWLWFIAIVDILYAVVCTIRLVYITFEGSFTEPDSFVWTYFVRSIYILFILLMGSGLLCGIRSEDDTSTLWYCKLWAACQLVFLFGSTIQGFVLVALYVSGSAPTTTVSILLLWFLRFVYNFGSFFLVKGFIGKLKQCERLTQKQGSPLVEHSEIELEQPIDYNNENNRNKPFGTGESSMCGPSVALLMSL